MNLAENAVAYKNGEHPGYVESAWAGLQESLETIAERGIKVVINGGCLNPAGLAAKVSSLVSITTPILLLLSDLTRQRRKTST